MDSYKVCQHETEQGFIKTIKEFVAQQILSLDTLFGLLDNLKNHSLYEISEINWGRRDLLDQL